MRPAWLVWAFASAVLVSARSKDAAKAEVLAEGAVKGETPAGTGEAVEYTTFNGIKVPPMKDLGEDFAEQTKSGYW